MEKCETLWKIKHIYKIQIIKVTEVISRKLFNVYNNTQFYKLIKFFPKVSCFAKTTIFCIIFYW